jgi:outer membrane autotransporter protein
MVYDQSSVFTGPVQIAPWEVWGQLFFSDERRDAQYQSLPLGLRRLIQARTTTETFGGNVGVERRLGDLTLGLAVGGAETDIRMRGVASVDVDSLAVMPYISYYRQGAFRGADFYADALYAYVDSDYRTRREPTGVRGSTDGHSHQIELNTGLNFRGGRLVHGPFGQLRWLDGQVDGYTESGLGGLTYGDADFESLATQLGYQVSMPIRVTGGTVIPQLSLAWEHEFETDQGSIGGVPLGELDEDVAVLGAGVGVYLNTGWNGILQYQARLGGDGEGHWVGLKVGKEF